MEQGFSLEVLDLYIDVLDVLHPEPRVVSAWLGL